jgi:hypothetical protein
MHFVVSEEVFPSLLFFYLPRLNRARRGREIHANLEEFAPVGEEGVA